MIETNSLRSLEKEGFKKVSIACGNFDGLHLGHQAIIQKLLEVSNQKDSTPVVLTFHPHPREVLTGKKVQNLTSQSTKLKLLAKLGVKALVTIPFTKEFASLEASSFVEDILLQNNLELCDLCIGSDWKFGKGREGDVEFLQNGNWAFDVHPIYEVEDKMGVISSSRIRKALSSGDFDLAQKLLGRKYSVSGTVVRGKGIAKSQLNFPTANIEISDLYLPLAGVYTCTVEVEDDGTNLPAVCNIGFAPTFEGHENRAANLEVHIFNFSKDIYGKNIEVAFTSFIRSEQKFTSVDLLKKQIEQDVIEAKRQFSIS